MTRKQMKEMGIDPNDFIILLEDEDIINIEDAIIIDDEDEEE